MNLQLNANPVETSSRKVVELKPTGVDKPTSYVDARQEAIDCLLSNGFIVLPVAPKQDPFKYPKNKKNRTTGEWEIDYEKDGVTPKPKFNGKNPSYLDVNGEPHLINHENYQEVQPTPSELETWFANPLNGVGTLCGRKKTRWADLDVKNFKSQADCDRAVEEWLDKYPQLRETFYERTHSGGYRFVVRCKNDPKFTNFTLEPGGTHVGEALGKGRFTVLAPTVGNSGNPYVNINRAFPVEVESLESIGIFPSKKDKSDIARVDRTSLELIVDNVNGLPLEKLGHNTSKAVLDGEDIKDDRSDSLATALNEWYGWENFCISNGLPIKGSADDLGYIAGEKLGLDEDRIKEIFKTVEYETCSPAAFYREGDVGCWKRIRTLNKGIYESRCPAELKPLVEESVENFKRQLADKDKAEWSDRPVESYYIEAELAKAEFNLSKYDWVLLTEKNTEISIYEVCVEHSLSTEKPPMPMIKACAFGRLKELFEAIPNVLDLAHCKGYWWVEYLQCKRKQTYDKIALHRVFGERLRFNSLLLQPEIDGEPVDLECTKNIMESTHKITLQGNQNEIVATLVSLSKERSFSPVVEYLENTRTAVEQGLTARTVLDKAFILEPYPQIPNAVWEDILRMYALYLQNFLVGAVARAYQPGCKMRTVLVLKGGQNIGKSEFFHVLAGNWFDDSISMTNDKDDKMKISRCWIAEWQELETIMGRKETGAVKQFISTSTDIIRLPYGRSVSDMPRPSVLGATVNEDHFLTDTTGSTRYQVIDIGDKKINLDWLKTNRDAIWGYALSLYESGCKWWIDDREIEVMQETLNRNYEKVDPWEQLITSRIEPITEITLDLVHSWVEPMIENRTQASNRRVTTILKKLGWKCDRHQTRLNGERVRLWRRQ
ncbi:bifunctional DNA primase/polymerase [Kovacikia minuta CCNUW1]|uniref:VapE domain-containing protein n=1 Tax=Kovacikia minuta TaxID=2931930 RepID=UPI001CCBBA07|nr:VapE domain-containing protein [Kovacikia minuta]UBF26421.1 bifunctional DNA primase/polymerase [Kovacikia minuta CCNUW1]